MPSDLRPVGPEFFDTAPTRLFYRAVIGTAPEVVFDAIGGDPRRWGDWFPGFDHSGHWLSDGPPGPGSRRQVRMARLTYDETVLAWERPARFAFRVDRSTAPLASALAEDYRITPHPAGSTFEWTFAIDPLPALRRLTGLFNPVLSRMFRKMAANLDHLDRLDHRPPA